MFSVQITEQKKSMGREQYCHIAPILSSVKGGSGRARNSYLEFLTQVLGASLALTKRYLVMAMTLRIQ